jgi:hypothetical protein
VVGTSLGPGFDVGHVPVIFGQPLGAALAAADAAAKNFGSLFRRESCPGRAFLFFGENDHVY